MLFDRLHTALLEEIKVSLLYIHIILRHLQLIPEFTIVYFLIYLFIYGSIKEHMSSSGYIVSNTKMIIHNELENVCKEAVNIITQRSTAM